jgi:RPA family protein
MRGPDDQSPPSRQLTVAEAATVLGVTVDAIRGRIKRGSLKSTKADDGTVYVVLADHDQPDGQSRLADDQSGLVEGLRGQVDAYADQVSFLRAELLTRNEELRRKDHIIAALTERIPELEAPPEAQEAPETASEAEAEEEERRPWWKRLFG